MNLHVFANSYNYLLKSKVILAILICEVNPLMWSLFSGRDVNLFKMFCVLL